MLFKFLKLSIVLAISTLALNASSFNAQAEKDRMALQKYFLAKYKAPMENKYTYFPYSTDHELTKIYTPITDIDEFTQGLYAFNKIQKEQRDEMMEMPPFEENIENGEVLFEKYFTKCFSAADIAGEYPKYSKADKRVYTLTQAIVKCARDQGLPGGKDGWNYKGGLTTDVQGFMAFSAQDAEKRVNVKIDSKEAQASYDEGKKNYYSQRGYLQLSCADCHVQGAGKRVRLDYLSSLLGASTHFPVYRISKDALVTYEKRVAGCVKDVGQKPPVLDGKWIANLIYFTSYMSNGLPVDGPDMRK